MPRPLYELAMLLMASRTERMRFNDSPHTYPAYVALNAAAKCAFYTMNPKDIADYSRANEQLSPAEYASFIDDMVYFGQTDWGIPEANDPRCPKEDSEYESEIFADAGITALWGKARPRVSYVDPVTHKLSSNGTTCHVLVYGEGFIHDASLEFVRVGGGNVLTPTGLIRSGRFRCSRLEGDLAVDGSIVGQYEVRVINCGEVLPTTKANLYLTIAP